VAWHPRFPPASRPIDVKPNGILRADFDLRVDAPETAAAGDDDAP
jgi:hypothetical protein